MTKFNSQLEEVIAERFQLALFKTQLKLATQDKWATPILTRRFDIVIYKGQNPLCVVEVRSLLGSKDILARGTDIVRSALSITNARFGIVTDNNQFFLYDRNNKDLDFVLTNFDDIIKTLINPEKIKVHKKDKNDILKIFIDSANKHLPDNQDLLNFIQSKLFINNIQFDQESNTYFLSENDVGLGSVENQLFIKIFGSFNENRICRYIPLKSMFDSLLYISYRMSSLIGMNDRSEVNYVDTYLNGVERPLIKMHHNTISALNNRYISSCTFFKMKDDLTMWRLYADDAKGVCQVFDVKKDNLNNHVLLQRIIYADKDGILKELDFLKDIRDLIVLLTGFPFVFRKIGYWKHFFKPFDYSIENEVRLLIIDNPTLAKIKTDWVMTNTHSIFNPFIDFQLNSKAFPIHLKEIILGPKCPEQETNYVQIQEMIRRKRTEIKQKNLDSNLNHVKVELSSIKHYR